MTDSNSIDISYNKKQVTQSDVKGALDKFSYLALENYIMARAKTNKLNIDYDYLKKMYPFIETDLEEINKDLLDKLFDKHNNDFKYIMQQLHVLQKKFKLPGTFEPHNVGDLMSDNYNDYIKKFLIDHLGDIGIQYYEDLRKLLLDLFSKIQPLD